MASSSTQMTDEGTYIAASQRPDGTWRKPRRVKDGYTPQEEVPLYESKGRHFSKHTNSTQYPVGLDPALIRAAEARKERQLEVTVKRSPIPGLVLDEPKTSKKKKKKSVPVSSLDEVNDVLSKVQLNFDTKSSPKETTTKNANKKESKESESTPADPVKRIKNLRKRLREIEAIEAKIAAGDTKKMEKEQLEKVTKKQEVLDEIYKLESLSIEEPLF